MNDDPERSECDFGLPHLYPKPDPTVGETSPIVSSCAVCSKSLHLHEITVMTDGEHLCLSFQCETVYRNSHFDTNKVTRL